MDLIPVMKQALETASAPAAGAAEFSVPADRQQEIGVTYATVERRALRRRLRAVGTVDCDRQLAWAYVARTDGYVNRLFVTSPGETVAVRQPLLTLEKNGRQGEEVTIYSPFRGVVKEVATGQGGEVKAGDKLLEVVDLSRVWIWADFYEADLGSLRQGQTATVTVEAYPGETFQGDVSLIDPFLDEGQRTFKVRIDIANADLRLRPGMYVDVAVDVAMGDGLVIPLNAVMPTGMRNMVFVDKGEGRLEPRNVKLGAEFDGCYQVLDGLRAGERIVSSAVFLIDAEAQIQGALKDFDGAGEARQ
jgi:Cu(I)/Ag(I) efflux system membrane fusion protein